MTDKQFTYADVAEHSSKKDLYIVIHDKVYNVSSFVDEHPYDSLFLIPHLECKKGGKLTIHNSNSLF